MFYVLHYDQHYFEPEDIERLRLRVEEAADLGGVVALPEGVTVERVGELSPVATLRAAFDGLGRQAV